MQFSIKIIAVLMGAGIAAASHAQFMPPRSGEAPGSQPQFNFIGVSPELSLQALAREFTRYSRE